MEISHWTRCNAIAAARKLLELWSCPQERADGEALKWLDGAPIEARTLRYSYDGQRNILNGLTLSIEAGRHTCITGESGSGKTTLCRVLAGNLAFTGSLRLASGSVTYVTGISRLFEGTLRDNINCFADKADDERLTRAAEAAQLTDFVQTLESGLDTMLEVHGDNLSGGQRMRIAIARALYQPGDVCIFDEPTSALDERTGYELVRAMINALQGHTVVIVTHDVRVADILREKGASVCMLQTMNAKTA